MTTYTSNLGLAIMTPGDPAVKNAWGNNLNNSVFSLLDTAIAGYLALSVAGAANVVLTVVDGAADQSRYKMFKFTGVLTGNIVVLWPNAKTGIFLVNNATTGAFTLALGVNNGGGAPAGTTVTVPQGSTGIFWSDGTNVSSSSGGLGTAATKAASDNSKANVASVATPVTAGGLAEFSDAAGTIQNSSIAASDVLTKSGNLAGLSSNAAAQANLGLQNMATFTEHNSNSGPSGGGSDGDLWLQW